MSEKTNYYKALAMIDAFLDATVPGVEGVAAVQIPVFFATLAVADELRQLRELLAPVVETYPGLEGIKVRNND